LKNISATFFIKMNFVRINGFPNYVIHPCGTILRVWKGYTTLKKHTKSTTGYMRVALCKNGKCKHFLVHRLLALHFIPNPENKRCVDHIRGKDMGNSLDNLRWVTHSENLFGFRKDRGVFAKITKGGIRKQGNSWEWQYQMYGKSKTKSMKSKDNLEKFRKEKLSLYK
tara:strand:+ start:407 stop:910 length:504 start_codon:yes stop_codon:yes gene_type:complete